MAEYLEPSRIARLRGFGMSVSADGYVFRPESPDEVPAILQGAREAGRQVVLRGTGLSYGDAAMLSEAAAIDLTRMNRILSWNPETGIVDAEAGATIEDLWRTCLPDGWWPPVVSGTMFPTLGGALAMNIHGKNAFREGPLGEHVLEIELVDGLGESRLLTPADPYFSAVVSGAGLLGVIVRVKLQLKRLASGNVRVLALSQPDWDSQFETMERYASEADYAVSWVDCFARGAAAGRGLVHAAWYCDGPPESFHAEHQDLPARTFGIPKSEVWRILRLLNNRPSMRLLNAIKHASGKLMENGKEEEQGIVAFNFLLDYVPNWRLAYSPGGFIQYQSFVPKEHAARVFSEQVRLQQEAGMEAFLGVLKRHRPDEFLFSHGVDGFSFALDFKVTPRDRGRLWALCHQMNDLVLGAGGKFYFAKDSTLRPDDVRAYLGAGTLERYRTVKAQLDPDHLFSSSLARRVGLDLDAGSGL